MAFSKWHINVHRCGRVRRIGNSPQSLVCNAGGYVGFMLFVGRAGSSFSGGCFGGSFALPAQVRVFDEVTEHRKYNAELILLCRYAANEMSQRIYKCFTLKFISDEKSKLFENAAAEWHHRVCDGSLQ
jgi:hypothetical protein